MAEIRSAVERIRSFGANVMSDQGRILVVNREKLSPAAMDFIKKNGREIASYLDHEAESEERAAIIEYDGGLTRPIAEYLTRLLMTHPPTGVDQSDWSWFVGQAAQVIDRSAPRRAA